MSYTLPKKLENLPKYDPVTEIYRVRLDANESFLEMPEEIKKEILEAVSSVEFNRYPDPNATKLCQKFGELFHVKPELLTAGNGSDELISIIVPNFLGEGDTMLTILPDFSMYTFYTRMVGAKAEALNKDEDMKVTPEQIIEKTAQCNAKLLVFSNPCNPTAVTMSREDILKIVGAVDAMVVVDEAYMEFSEGSVLDEIENYDNLIVLKTCSKAFGMAAIRLGFAAANARITNILKTLKAPYNVNSMTQAVGCVILGHREYLEKCTVQIKESTQELYQSMAALAEKKKDIQKLYPTETNFLYIKTEHSGEIFEALKKDGISIRNMNGYLRISAGSKAENQELIQALDKLLQ